ncbi:MAG TPA: helix-turn-helix domain-containing protein [Flavobacterium sp.]|nr:helix-turn-helix domain-containing protein [Flavobacterium sp.]
MKKNVKICPIDYSIDLLSKKWTLPIIYALVKKSPKRFKELEREITGISPNILSTRLKELEFNHLIEREVFPTIPPTVEYGLTEHANGLKSVFNELENFGLYHQKIKQ